MIPTLPPRARDRLAGTILAALHDAAARRELRLLADEVARSRQWLGDEAQHAETLRARASRATQALSRRPITGQADLPSLFAYPLEAALEDARLLFDAGLYFEVHELLEPHWQQATGTARQALQGLIQIAVGYQHLANGNLAGARSLLAEGARRLTGCAIAGRSLDPFARQVLVSAESGSPSIPSFPRRT
jgi:hypothetical protein